MLPHSPVLNVPLLIVSDVHIEHGQSRRVVDDLVSLLGNHEGYEWVFNGDTFSLSAEPIERAPQEALGALHVAHPNLARTLRAHLRRGGGVTFIAGNHDAALVRSEARSELLAVLDVPAASKLHISPWFVRRGGIHIEHGHRFDPDNAPRHPLLPWSPKTEPLGVALTRRFVSKHAAFAFAHAHETTFLEGMGRAFETYGARAPLLIARYFQTAGELTWEALAGRTHVDTTAASAALERFRSEQTQEGALGLETLQALILLGAAPTHENFSATFLRLYFDRILGALGTGLGAALWLTRLGLPRFGPLGQAATLASGAYVAYSTLSRPNRYRGVPESRLREGAAKVRELTQADLVVLGHTHTVEITTNYVNLGSFGYARNNGRPYLVAQPGRAPELRWLKVT